MILEHQEQHLKTLADYDYRLKEIQMRLMPPIPEAIPGGRDGRRIDEPETQLINIHTTQLAMDQLIQSINNRMVHIEEALGIRAQTPKAALSGQGKSDNYIQDISLYPQNRR